MMGKGSRERWAQSANRRQAVRMDSLRKQHLSKALGKVACTLIHNMCSASTPGHIGIDAEHMVCIRET